MPEQKLKVFGWWCYFWLCFLFQILDKSTIYYYISYFFFIKRIVGRTLSRASFHIFLFWLGFFFWHNSFLYHCTVCQILQSQFFFKFDWFFSPLNVLNALQSAKNDTSFTHNKTFRSSKKIKQIKNMGKHSQTPRRSNKWHSWTRVALVDHNMLIHFYSCWWLPVCPRVIHLYPGSAVPVIQPQPTLVPQEPHQQLRH